MVLVPGGSGRLRGARLRRFQAALLAWYGPRARPLRIRTTRDPWAILVSEVMAQQTQIARVDEAWAVFMERYPDAAGAGRRPRRPRCCAPGPAWATTAEP